MSFCTVRRGCVFVYLLPVCTVLAQIAITEEAHDAMLRDRILVLQSSAPDAAKRRAAHDLGNAFRHGQGSLSDEELVPALSSAALEHHDPVLRTNATRALARLRSESAVQPLIQALSDDEQQVQLAAIDGLRQLGAAAAEAVPALARGVRGGTLPPRAIGALVAVGGCETIDVVLEQLELADSDRELTFQVTVALSQCPDRRGFDFMADRFRAGNATEQARAAMYFSQVEDERAADHMRAALRMQTAGQGTPADVRDAGRIRGIAAGYFGRRQEPEQLPLIMTIAESDPYYRTRTEAVKALGLYADPAAIDVLERVSRQDDTGQHAQGHVPGTLHGSVADALAAIGTDDALSVLYRGVVGEQEAFRRASAAYWTRSDDPQTLDRFLSFYDRQPPEDGDPAARIILLMLWRHREVTAIEGAEAEALREDFHRNVRDPQRFGPDADLTLDGRFVVDPPVLSFFRGGFAYAIFNLRRPGGLIETIHHVLYRRTEDGWLPVGLAAQEWT